MNVHTPEMEAIPDHNDAKEVVSLLKRWRNSASLSEILELDPSIARLGTNDNFNDYPMLERSYPDNFDADTAYKQSLPDLQNGPSSLIRGSQQHIQHVGISNFRLPLNIRTRSGDALVLETSVTGTVSLEADKKGINMSRIMRSFYEYADETFSFELIESVLNDYKSDLESIDARIQMKFSFPMKMESLRSGLFGFQYYDISLEVVEKAGVRKKIIHLDYVYSSTCPCSLELSEHARVTRGQLATPHSQRSIARISVVVCNDQNHLWFEDLIEGCRCAVPTETQVMVKREDEQAFAELNAANPIFVEDAARLFCQKLLADPRVADFRVIASHQESLHSHDAVSILTEGDTFANDSIDPKMFASLFHVG